MRRCLMKKNNFPVKVLLMVLFLSIACSLSFADVITIPNNTEFSFAVTAEFILSYEHVFSKKATGLIWFGGGVIQALKKETSFLSGLEAALAFRYYFKPAAYDKFFVGIYGGGCVIHTIGRHIVDQFSYPWQGITFGAKIGYKKIIVRSGNGCIVIEPYTSIAASFQQPLGFYPGEPKREFSSPLITIGVRYVFEWLHKKK